MKEFGSPVFPEKQKNPKPETRRISASPSSIPFSWERQPGVPKLSTRNPRANAQSDPHLPPPPPLIRSAPDKNRRKPRSDKDEFGRDPFAAALAECTRTIKRNPACVAAADVAQRRRGRALVGTTLLRVGDRVGLMGIFGSCKAAASCSASEPAFYDPSRARAYGYGFSNRRFG